MLFKNKSRNSRTDAKEDLHKLRIIQNLNHLYKLLLQTIHNYEFHTIVLNWSFIRIKAIGLNFTDPLPHTERINKNYNLINKHQLLLRICVINLKIFSELITSDSWLHHVSFLSSQIFLRLKWEDLR